MKPKPAERVTKYQLLAQELRCQIEDGTLGPGEQLPSYGEMRERYGASLATVGSALSILEREGLVVRINGRGTFVTEHRHPTGTAGTALQTAAELPFIGLILPRHQEEVFFEPIISGLEEECQAAGYDLIVANSRANRDLEAQLLAKMSRQTAGLCVMPSRQADAGAYGDLLARGFPLVLLDRSVEGLDVPLVANDNEAGGYEATRHLLELGRRRIYVLSAAMEGLSPLQERVSGYRRALDEAGVAFDPSLLRTLKLSPDEAGYELTRKLLANERGLAPFAIFALNEAVASGCYRALKESRLRIPDDVAIVGFDDVFAELFDPPLSAVHQDLSGIGRATARLLVQGIRGANSFNARVQRLPCELIVRGSSDARAGAKSPHLAALPQLQNGWTTRLLASRHSADPDSRQPA